MISKNMIFRNTLFGVAVCLAGVLTACAEKELDVVEPVGEEQQVEICFAPTIGADISTKGSDVQPIGETGLYLRTVVSENKTNPFDAVATRATLVNGFDPEGGEGTYSTFKVYSFLHDGAWAENYEDATPYINGIDAVSLGNGYWGFEESVFWPAWDTNMTFLSYAAPEDSDLDISFTEDDGNGNYVYAAPTLVYSDPAVADDDTHHGEISDDNLAKQYDLLVAQTPDLTKETITIPMNFTHVFASVQFLCGNMTGGKITKLSLANIAHEGVYDFGTGTWEVDADNRTEYVFPLTVTVPETEDDVDLDAGDKMESYDTNILGGSSALMMVPQDLTGSALLLEYTPTGDDEPMELAVELSGSWEAGAHITYHISFLAGNDDVIPYLEGTDGIFAAYVLAHFDTDGDGHVSQEEADAVTELKIGYYPNDDEAQTSTTTIDFAGIEHFTNLEKFTSNRANALDLSQNAKLNYIYLALDEGYAPTIKDLNLTYNLELTEIPEHAFDSTPLTSIELPETLEKIGAYAFYQQSGTTITSSNSLTEIKLPDSVTEIGEYAFYDLEYLKTINIPDGVTELKDYTFYRCRRALESITLPEKMTKIGKNVFQTCTTLVSINMPAYLQELGEYAFSGCSALNPTGGIVIPEGVTEIGDRAFQTCSSLTSLTLQDGLTSIGEYAFSGCTKLASPISLPSTLETIGNYAFGGSAATTAVTATFTVPEEGFTALTSIGNYGFAYCTGLTTFPLSDSVTSIGNHAFDGCAALTDITKIPGELETLGEYAFRNCTALTTDIVIPETITEIEQYAFYYCASKFVELPSTMTKVGNYAFQHCPAIETFICRAATPPSTGNSYSLSFDADPLPILYVYSSSVSAYTSATYWGNSNARFSTIRTIEEYENPVEPTGNYALYVGEGITIGDRTYSEATDGPATWITKDSDYSFSGVTTGIYFVDSDVELTFNPNSNVSKFILIGNDPNNLTKATMTRRLEVSPTYTDADEIVLYNIDLDAYTNSSSSVMSSSLVYVNSGGEVGYLAFVNCHIHEASSYGIINFNSYTDGYFSEAYISDCVWSLGSSATSLFRLNDNCTATIKSLTMKNNLFYDYSTSVETDFRVLRAAGATLTNLVYENNTLINLGSSTASATYGAFEYASIGEASVTKNLTYVANNNNYVFFHSSALPKTTTGVTDNIAYLYSGSGSTYGSWYWLYDGTDLSNPSELENACTVLTESPFDKLEINTDTGTATFDIDFTVNAQYSDYGYQASTTSGDTGTTEP